MRKDRESMYDWQLLEAARSYAERGWAVLPLHAIRDGCCTCGKANCPSPGKHPLTAHGVRDATTDIDQVQAWWIDWPWANVGIALGSPSGLVVIDVDERSGGVVSLSSLASLIPQTRTAQTGGGLHLYLSTDRSIRTHALAPGVELRADGAYVVAPPSRHANGATYHWIDERDIAPLPDALLKEDHGLGWEATRNEKQNGHVTVTDPTNTVKGHNLRVQPSGHWVAELLRTNVPEGQRNASLTRIAGYLRNVLPHAVTTQILRHWNDTHCQPPLPERELITTIDGIYRRYNPVIPMTVEAWTAQSLMAQEFPAPRQIITGLLPEGLALLGGRPKRGKSWLALQLAVDVVTGRASLGRSETGRVLVLALEDSARRLQQRLHALDCPETTDLHLVTAFPPLYGGGIGDLCDLITRIDPTLVVIDTLSRAFVGLPEQDRSDQMTRALAPLQQLALAQRMAILIIDHHRKPGPDVVDMIDDIIGSTAKVGVADTVLGLYRKTGEDAAILKITGRDIAERELSLRWDSVRFRWVSEGDANETAYLRHRQQILSFLGEVEESDAETIGEEVHLGYRTAYTVLQRMRDENLITVRYESRPRGRPRGLYRARPFGEKGGQDNS